MKYYAGIGSRETPQEFLEFFTKLAKFLYSKGYTLRSGGANGSDRAFEIGAKNKKEIYLPWVGFNGNSSKLVVKDVRAFKIASKYHPRWNYLSQGAKLLQARNSHQILGWDLNTPSDFVICWTKGGKGQGGTGQALRLARGYNIPIFDCGNFDSMEECKPELLNFLKEMSRKYPKSLA